MGSPPTKVPNSGAWVRKIGDCRPIIDYYTIYLGNGVRRSNYERLIGIPSTLSNGTISSDLELPINTPDHPIYYIILNHRERGRSTLHGGPVPLRPLGRPVVFY